MDLREKILTKPKKIPVYFKVSSKKILIGLYLSGWFCVFTLFFYFFIGIPMLKAMEEIQPGVKDTFLIHPDTLILLIAICLSLILLFIGWTYYKKD